MPGCVVHFLSIPGFEVSSPYSLFEAPLPLLRIGVPRTKQDTLIIA